MRLHPPLIKLTFSRTPCRPLAGFIVIKNMIDAQTIDEMNSLLDADTAAQVSGCATRRKKASTLACLRAPKVMVFAWAIDCAEPSGPGTTSASAFCSLEELGTHSFSSWHATSCCRSFA